MEIKRIILALILCIIVTSCSENENTFSEQKNLIIASKQIDCTGVGTQKCYLIKESKNAAWEYFYNGITGFNYEEGFEYEISVLLEVITNPAQDDSSIEYKLLEVVSKKEKESENLLK